MSKEDQPINDVLWLPRDVLRANDYNPNIVAPPELALLECSIAEDGWTQPIVARKDGRKKTMEIVDGFHRWMISERPSIASLTDGYVPVVLTRNGTPDAQRLSTIRHNRARGEHYVVKMAEIVSELIDMGMEPDEIMSRLGMEDEEVDRLVDRGSMIKRASADDFQSAWRPAPMEEPEAT